MHTSQHSGKSPSALKRLRLLPQRHRFTPPEVRRRLLSEDLSDPRTSAVRAAAARTAVWSALLSDRTAFELGRAAMRLPSIVYWYVQGVPPDQIGQRLSLFGSAWDAERALDVATSLIARSLNEPSPDEVAA